MNPTILVVSEAYLPGFLAGGPVRSLAGLVEALGDEFQWKIVTTDRDFRAKEPYANIQSDCWTRVGKADVWYASPAQLGILALCRILQETPSDLLYLNSFFSPRFSMLPVFARKIGVLDHRPILIAPRGEFSPGALELKSWKKAKYLAMARFLALYRSVYWHATAENERDDIVRSIEPCPALIKLASNIASRGGPATHTPRSVDSPLRVCFLSRISRKKNLDFALEALARVTEPVIFTVYGPVEDEDYWAECLQAAARLPRNVAFNYEGPVPHEHVHDELSKQDLFFLPTRGENFGHALVEAWSAGLPVLTSDRTPWRELQAKGVGWDLTMNDDSHDQFAAVVDNVARMDTSDALAIRLCASNFAASFAANGEAIKSSRNAFLAAMGKR